MSWDFTKKREAKCELINPKAELFIHLMPPCALKLLLDGNRPPFYTNLDTIRGKVVLTVYGVIDVENIQVKFEGFAKTEIVVRKNSFQNGQPRSRRVTKSENHTLVYQCITLFPPPNVREVSQSNSFTLTPGTYEYEFDFKIPMMNQCGAPGQNGFGHSPSSLPPSITGDGYNIEYFVKVTVRRPSLMKFNMREIHDITLTPFDPIDEILEAQLSL